eukprot:CAMPEP_0195095816 /NCGR_PEP_ID=MMETSP0448-20130528/48836_1 /TAXON_ID=66468 /ORGANISM="Heterocapsa triquestra, Strain CCMP 448" /LENGTH=41 /DNA_ID= /DNA_START= /DNA_END= /DNA_ORIENTATION=
MQAGAINRPLPKACARKAALSLLECPQHPTKPTQLGGMMQS